MWPVFLMGLLSGLKRSWPCFRGGQSARFSASVLPAASPHLLTEHPETRPEVDPDLGALLANSSPCTCLLPVAVYVPCRLACHSEPATDSALDPGHAARIPVCRQRMTGAGRLACSSGLHPEGFETGKSACLASG